jgi:hypothetical protein
MMIHAICRDIRPHGEDANGGSIVVAAADDALGSSVACLPIDPSTLTKARSTLAALGIVLGGSGSANTGRTAPSEDHANGLRSPVQISAQDECGKEHSLCAQSMEEYSLSSGGKLYFLGVSEAADKLQWLRGKALTLTTVESCPVPATS